MALDLFVNFERSQNSDIFYRSINPTGYTCTVKLSDIQAESSYQTEVANNFFAKYSLNNSSPTSLNLLSGVTLTLSRSIPTTHVLKVYLYGYDDNAQETLINTYAMSAVFVDSFPTASFKAFPRTVVNEKTGRMSLLNSTNYNFFEENGLSFYGEGHTETIFLSTTTTSPFVQWFVGNELNDLTKSVYSISNIIGTNLPSYLTHIASTPALSASIPITLVLRNNQIKKTPKSAYYYNDQTGAKVFYPFIASSLNLDGTENTNNSQFQQNIKIKTYPSAYDSIKFISPFKSDIISLPASYENSSFTGRISSLNNEAYGFVNKVDATVWTLSTTQDSFSTQGNWSYQTPVLDNFKAYQFPLSYDSVYTETPSILKVSSINETFITVAVSASVTNQLIPTNWKNHDWKPRTETVVYQDTAIILTRPTIKIFAPNYYNLLNQKTVDGNNVVNIGTKFLLDLSNIHSDYKIQNIAIYATNYSTAVILTSKDLNSPFYIDFVDTGTQTLTAVAEVETPEGTEIITNVFPNIVETLLEFDNTARGSTYYKSEFTTLNLTTTSAPLISPNEWAVNDNINNSIETLYSVVDDLKTGLFRYKKTSFVYGWLGSNKYKWSDLECEDNNISKLSWSDNDCNTDLSSLNQDVDGFPLYWNQQRCEKVIRDPSCFQRYCLEWKWTKRRRRPSSVVVTWASAQKTGTYAKKWKFEPCEIDSIPLDCNKGTWHFSTIDPEYFPIPFCSTNNECEVKSCIKLSNDKLLTVYNSELNILSNEYEPTLLARRGVADELFNFASIEGVSLNSNKTKLYVVDSILCKVCVYEFKDEVTLNLINSWGRFGFKTDAYGFNNPSDIYVDPTSSKVIVTDKGNKCLKVYTPVGFHLNTLSIPEFETNIPLSVCVDSQNYIHVLTELFVYVLDWSGNLLFNYSISNNTSIPKKLSLIHI